MTDHEQALQRTGGGRLGKAAEAKLAIAKEESETERRELERELA